jgi:hypothetical protein
VRKRKERARFDQGTTLPPIDLGREPCRDGRHESRYPRGGNQSEYRELAPFLYAFATVGEVSVAPGEHVSLGEYAERLQAILGSPASPLTDEECGALRAIVRECRSGRAQQTIASPAVHERADEIVELLGRAARHLRPRETQQLDDLVAGRERTVAPEPSYPIRLHRHGWPGR